MTNKINQWITKFYYCPICEYCEKDKQSVKDHIKNEHTKEEINNYLKEVE